MTDIRTSSKRILILSFVLFLAVLLGVFSIQMKSALDGFDRWVGHEDHRLPNIRLVPKECRWAAINRFIELQPVDKADAFIFGDSQMFARGATQEQIFYTEWLGEDAIIINFSFLAARVSEMRKIADELNRKNIKAPQLIQNVNISHYAKLNNTGVPGEIEKPHHPEFLPSDTNRLERLYKNRALCAFRMRKSFTNGDLRTPRYRKLLPKFSKVKLSEFFTSFDKTTFYDLVPQHIDSFKNISDRPIFITAPMAYDKFEIYNFDVENLEKFAVNFQKLCDENKDIECHDLTRVMTSEGFMDLIHMNAAGHKMLGQELKRLTAE